jgi:hypothetical protein
MSDTKRILIAVTGDEGHLLIDPALTNLNRNTTKTL